MLRIRSKQTRVDADVVRRACLNVRRVRQWTQSDLAQKSGLSLSVVQRIEQGSQHTFPRNVYDALRKLVEEPADKTA